MKATCMDCGTTFETDRSDAMFHSDACRASYYRKAGATGKHENLDRMKSKHCEFCGNLFWFNDYADRKGKRIPSYCRDACRVAAFRARRKSADKRQRTAHENPNSWEAYQQKNRQKTQEPPKQSRASDFRDKLKAPSRWTEQDAYIWLGVPPYSSKKVCQDAWRTLNGRHHPDANKGSVWPHLVHVNAAYDYLKRRVWKSASRPF